MKIYLLESGVSLIPTDKLNKGGGLFEGPGRMVCKGQGGVNPLPTNRIPKCRFRTLDEMQPIVAKQVEYDEQRASDYLDWFEKSPNVFNLEMTETFNDILFYLADDTWDVRYWSDRCYSFVVAFQQNMTKMGQSIN